MSLIGPDNQPYTGDMAIFSDGWLESCVDLKDCGRTSVTMNVKIPSSFTRLSLKITGRNICPSVDEPAYFEGLISQNYEVVGSRSQREYKKCEWNEPQTSSESCTLTCLGNKNDSAVLLKLFHDDLVHMAVCELHVFQVL